MMSRKATLRLLKVKSCRLFLVIKRLRPAISVESTPFFEGLEIWQDIVAMSIQNGRE